MNSFSTSTHCKNWIKTEKELEKIEKSKLERILKRISEVNMSIKKEYEEKSHNSINLITNQPKNIITNEEGNPQANFRKYITKKKLITPNEEMNLIIHYCGLLLQILNTNKDLKSSTLKNISLTYFRRFFLKKSIIDYDIIYLMAAAVFLGSKVAPINLSIQDIEKIFPAVKNSDKKFFDYEFFLCTILEYDFYVYNPYLALMGFIFNLEQKEFFLAQSSENYVNPNEFQQECIDLIDKMYLTNNIFLFTYSEIALGSIFIKCEQKNISTINIAEKLELDKVINVKEFLEGPLKKMKENLDLIPKYENNEKKKKINHDIFKKIDNFHKSFPEYQKKLDNERSALKNKMKNFTDDFEVFEKPILKSLAKK